MSNLAAIAKELLAIRPAYWLWCAALLVAESVLALILPRLAGQTAELWWSAQTDGIGLMAGLALSVLAAQAVLSIAGSGLLAAMTEDVIAELKMRMYLRLQALPLECHRLTSRDESVRLVTRDARDAGRALTSAVLESVPLAIVVGGAALMLVYLQPVLGFVTVASVTIVLVCARLIVRRVGTAAESVRRMEETGNALLQGHLAGIDTLKQYGGESELAGQFEGHRIRARLASKRLALGRAFLRRAGSFGVNGAILASGLAVSGALPGPALGPGGLVAFLLYGLALSRAVARIVGLREAFARGRVALGRVAEAVRFPTDASGTHAPAPVEVSGRVAVRGLSFGYSESSWVLDDLDLDIDPGEVLAVTGPNGVGKTTLLELLCGALHPRSGEILLSGIPLPRWDLEALRRAVTMVPQSPRWLPFSVRVNLTLGGGPIDEVRLTWALKTSGANAVVAGLPERLETPLGPGGRPVSSGESQRLALARALYRRPTLLLVDEPTAMFDPGAEEAFVRRARLDLYGTTLLLVTRRAGTLALADRVLELGARGWVESRRCGKVIRGPW